MTIARPETAGAPEEPTAGSGRYYISLPRLEQLSRSAVHLISSRLTEDCPSYGLPVADMPSPVTLIREIRESHADTPGFIRADMPIQEIVFRTLLARGNSPMSLSDLHYELTVRWSNALRPISIDEERLRRVLDEDTYYGFDQA